MIKRILDILEFTLKIICGVFISVIVGILFYAVVMRYVFHRPPSWSIEVSRYMFIWMVMLGAVLVTREQSHVKITFFTNLMPEKFRFFWLNFIRIMMIVCCWIIIKQGLIIHPIVASASSPCLGLSMGWVYLSTIAGSILMIVYILEVIARSIIEHVRTNPS